MKRSNKRILSHKILTLFLKIQTLNHLLLLESKTSFNFHLTQIKTK